MKSLRTLYSQLALALVVLLLVGGTSALVWKTAPSQLTDSQHDVPSGFKKTKVYLAPTLAHCWTFAMGSMDSNQYCLVASASPESCLSTAGQ